MNLSLSPNAKIFPWSKAQTRENIKEACRIIERKAKEQGVDFRWSIRGGIPVITTWRVGNGSTLARGSWDGTRIKLQSGQSPMGNKAPFNTVDALARILMHEFGHARGLGHRNSGIMHPNATQWFDNGDVIWLQRIYGKLQPPKTSAQRIKEINQEIRRLADGLKALRKRMKPSQERIKELKEERQRLRDKR